jgi:hypothetical protein
MKKVNAGDESAADQAARAVKRARRERRRQRRAAAVDQAIRPLLARVGQMRARIAELEAAAAATKEKSQ